MDLIFLKKYGSIFLLTYLLIFFTKLIFTYYLNENFNDYSWIELFYAILWGYKFDFASSAIVAFLVTLFDWHKKLFAIVGTLFFLVVFLLQIGDIIYFNEASRHIGYEITDTLTDAGSLFMTAYSQHTSLTVGSLLFSLVLAVVILKILFKSPIVLLTRGYVIQKLLLVVISIFFVRGMVQHIPLNPWQSNQIGDSKLAILSLNSFYNVVYILANSSKKLDKVKLPIVNKATVQKAFLHLYPETPSNHKSLLEKPNIVFLFLESWSAVNMKSYGFEKETTPFYDALLKKSIYPKAMIASGHRTTEGIFAALVSAQNPLGKSVVKSNLQDFHYRSIIDILNEEGYGSGFFQGSSKETSGTGSLVQALGFKESYGKRDVKKRIYDENYWGIHDPDLYNFTLNKIEGMKKPFVVGINGATTHDDKLPNGVEKIDFVKDKNHNNQLNALHFSDKALGDFMTKVELKYPNTLFVLFADHCGGGIKESSFDSYKIPFSLYYKGIEPKQYDVYLSQRDIAPTVLDMVLANYKKVALNFSGKSLLTDRTFFADYYHNGLLGWIENEKIIEINLAINEEKCYEIVNFKSQEIKCEDDMLRLKDNALSFTQVSQDLLFQGKVENFGQMRDGK